jgi:threonyl-tRNA synthetase
MTARLEAVSPSFAAAINERAGKAVIGEERIKDPTTLLDGFLLKPIIDCGLAH